MRNITWLEQTDIEYFPAPELALKDPDGLLAIGGNLSAPTLLAAYRRGIFPWFSDGDPIMWWSPSERAVIIPQQIHISKNLKKLIRQQRYQVTVDRQFATVIKHCSQSTTLTPRSETWITEAMQQAYQGLFDKGDAHSVEVWNKDQQLVGGLYGVFVKNCFCGESMFSSESNTSKLALIYLANFLHNAGAELIDCQIPTAHLASMGAVTLSRQEFLSKLNKMEENITLIKQPWNNLWQPFSV